MKPAEQFFAPQDQEKRVAEYEARYNEDNLVSNDYRGLAFVEPVKGGTRTYTHQTNEEATRPENRYLMLLGTLLAFAGIFGFFVEYRLRRVSPG